MKSSLTVMSNNPLTISSQEMVDYINAERKAKADAEGFAFPCKQYRRLSHKNFMAKVPKVLGYVHSANFLAQYKDSTGRELPYYELPKREACLMAMSYIYELQARVFDHMTKNEKQQLETVARYLNDGHQLLNCGRTQAGVLLDALLAMQDAKRRKPSDS